MTTETLMALADKLRWATYHHADSENGQDDVAEARAALQSAIEALVRDAERINFLRWSKEIVIAKADEYGVLRKSSIPTLDAAIAVQGVK